MAVLLQSTALKRNIQTYKIATNDLTVTDYDSRVRCAGVGVDVDVGGMWSTWQPSED